MASTCLADLRPGYHTGMHELTHSFPAVLTNASVTPWMSSGPLKGSLPKVVSSATSSGRSVWKTTCSPSREIALPPVALQNRQLIGAGRTPSQFLETRDVQARSERGT